MSASTESGEHTLSASDELELVRLIIEISWRIDHGKAGTVHELFVNDGELNVGPDQVLRGHEAIRGWGDSIDRLGWTIRHVCTNMRFTADGADAAEGTTLVTAYMHELNGQALTLPLAVGEDHDRFQRSKAGWRVVSRRWEQLFTRPSS